MNNFQTQVQSIQQAYPEIEVTAVESIESGQYNLVLMVNDAYVFRFPKYEPGVEQMTLEAKILTAVQPYLTLSVPDPLYQQLESAIVGQAFMGYPIIPGEPLWLPTFQSIRDESTKSRLAIQLAQFLKELHGINIQPLVDEAIPVCDTREEWLDVYGRVQNKLFPFMHIDACKSVADHFETMLDGSGFDYQPCLRHGDFGTGNILYNPSDPKITGIIDFSFTTFGDPAFDFAGLLTFGEDFVRQMRKTYPALDSYWERIWFYKGTFALLEALFGFENGDQVAFKSGIAEYV